MTEILIEKVLENQQDLDLGVEAELNEGYEDIEITKPFDPEKIKVNPAIRTIDLLLDRIDHNEIDLEPDFQRKARIWPNHKKSQLIESLLLKIPLPAFYVAADKKEDWAVVDGLQRLTTISDFSKNAFKLTGLEYLTKLEGVYYSDLPRNMKRRIGETQLNFNVIEPGTPEEVMFNIFKRINTGGISLNGQEIRNALHKGPVRDFLAQLANSKEFLEVTDNSVNDKRMTARECVLRFAAFYTTNWEQYEYNDLDGFLSNTMKYINAISPEERKLLQNAFLRSMHIAYEIFGTDAFRKRYSVQDSKKPVNKPLFEAWSVNLALLKDEEVEVLLNNRDNVKKKFIDLMVLDRDFESAISSSTGIPKKVKIRFNTIQSLLRNIIDDN